MSAQPQRPAENPSPAILWQPSAAQIQASKMDSFRHHAEQRAGRALPDYHSLWQWSVDHRPDFWSLVWDECGVIGDKGDIAAMGAEQMRGTKWFPQARLNFAENCLQRDDHGQAIVFWAEDKIRRQWSWRELRQHVAQIQQFFTQSGITANDRIAGFVANMPETTAAMLAAASLGATWSSCSPDFGVQGVLDRFQQIAPKILVAVDGYYYKAQVVDCLPRLREICAQLPSVERVLVIPYAQAVPDLSGLPNAILISDLFTKPAAPLQFTRLAFDHPLYIMFSSGTTGVPKCIVHGAGGTLLQHLKEHQLQSDIRRDDRVFYFTTCGWMMWNWQQTALASGATLLQYEGFPFQQRGQVIFNLLQNERATLFGTSAKFIDAVAKLELNPAMTHDLSALRLTTSTGSPLSPEGFDYVYRNIKADMGLASIAGGTDIVSCFVLGNPISPVYKGEIMGAGLGMDVAVMDDDGKKIIGEKGELVCCHSFPSMPIGFFGDTDGQKYHNAYFARFDHIWCHGDYAEQTATGGFVIYGRSDATLKPGGVRIGTAEIYRVVEQLPEVEESIVIGQDWDHDVRVVLFVKLRAGAVLDENLQKTITTNIRQQTSPRHVPAKIIAVADIPRTKSGKIVELAVRDVVHGRAVKNTEALANPEALQHFKDLAALRS